MKVQQQTNGSRRVLLLGAALGAGLIGKKMLERSREADLTGNVALITGGTSGLGLLLAREFALAGCKITICARDEDELRLAREELARHDVDVLAIPCDVAARAQVAQLVERTTDHFGQVDILVNNAGIIQVGPLETMEENDFKSAMDVMFWGAIFPTLEVLPQMRERGSGRIVNITSIGGKVSVPHLVPYSSAKFATVGFSEGIRSELKKDGVSVTTIVPGLMRTGSFLNAQFKGEQDKEFIWFSLGSSLPFVSMDAERAARQIVQATRRGDAERILSIPANIITKAHGLFPGATADLLSMVNQLVLPDAEQDGGGQKSGQTAQEELDSTAQQAATALGQASAERFQPTDDGSPEIWDEPRN